MKRIVSLLLILSLAGCGQQIPEAPKPTEEWPGAVTVRLYDDGVETDSDAVYTDHDIIYYEEGKDFTYGEGTEADAHSAEEAAEHTVVHITRPGTYVLQGKLAKGQIAVDLGEEAEEDPNAVVTLVLNGVDITCTVAPAVIFYNVYECGSTDTETATKEVDTSAAGANVYIAADTTNYVNGSYVARIYQPGTVELSEDGNEVLDAKKLHKYDATFYSKMSMNVDGGENGSLHIKAENEGLDSELHLTINGGAITIVSGNDGINTNEDGVSVTTINGGAVSILVTGETGEGDGIDSNGWLVINGGTVIASACSDSADSGIDSDMGIHINGGTVMAAGHMLDHIEGGGQNYAVFNFAAVQSGDDSITLKNESGEELMSLLPQNDYSVLIYSSPELREGEYTIWSDNKQLSVGAGMGGFGGGMRPGGKLPEMPEGMEPPEHDQHPQRPEGMDRPGGFGGQRPGGQASETVTITEGGNMFSVQ